MVELTNEQSRAADAIEDFIRDLDSPKPYLVTHGLAGVGKSVLLAAIARRYPRAVTCAYTGKAASILRAKTGLATTTIHSAIYMFHGLVDDEVNPNKKNPVFIDKEEDFTGRLILVDESSMLGAKIAGDLINTGAKIVCAGDPGQLPPVKDRQFFREADLRLTEIHRQALESPIIRQAHSVRATGQYSADGEDFRVVDRVTLSDLKEVDIVLCWRNQTRRILGNSRRRAFGFEGPIVRAGEPVMCLKNDHHLRIFNGAVYEVATEREPGDGLNLIVEGRFVIVPDVTIEGIDPGFERDQYRDDLTPFALAYAVTIHKAQGDEWKNVLLIDEFDDAAERRALLYTGITRAAKRITIVRKR